MFFCVLRYSYHTVPSQLSFFFQNKTRVLFKFPKNFSVLTFVYLTFYGHHRAEFSIQKVKPPLKVILLLPGKIQKRKTFVVSINRNTSILLQNCVKSRNVRQRCSPQSCKRRNEASYASRLGLNLLLNATMCQQTEK